MSKPQPMQRRGARSAELAKGQKECGLMMPISAIGDCDESHWSDVKGILGEVANENGFMLKLVSESDSVNIIQKTIVQRLHDDVITIADVSCMNPNVMLELGIRLAFDKAVIIIKDDLTGYSFDTSPIRHVSYPRDLRYPKIEEFKKDLGQRMKQLYDEAVKPNYSMFLNTFGKFTKPKFEAEEVPGMEYLSSQINELKFFVQRSLAAPHRSRFADESLFLDGFASMRHMNPTEWQNIDRKAFAESIRHFCKNQGYAVGERDLHDFMEAYVVHHLIGEEDQS